MKAKVKAEEFFLVEVTLCFHSTLNQKSAIVLNRQFLFCFFFVCCDSEAWGL